MCAFSLLKNNTFIVVSVFMQFALTRGKKNNKPKFELIVLVFILDLSDFITRTLYFQTILRLLVVESIQLSMNI